MRGASKVTTVGAGVSYETERDRKTGVLNGEEREWGIRPPA